MQHSPQTGRVRVARVPSRGHYDRATIDSVLDAGIVAHIAIMADGYPVAMPTLYWREQDHVYWHGANTSRLMRAANGAQVGLTVTHLDGLVLAHSAFHHSANYRSVVVLGEARAVSDPELRLRCLERMVESIYPGRWRQLRPITKTEFNATMVLSLPLTEASAKLRCGPVDEDPEDVSWPSWAGIMPIHSTFGTPEPDGKGRSGSFATPIVARPLCNRDQ